MAIKKIIQQRRNQSNTDWEILHAQTSADVVLYNDAQTQLNAENVQEAIEQLKSLAEQGIIISDTAPAEAEIGDLWFDTTTASLYLYYDDGTTISWIEVGGMNGVTGITVSPNPPANPNNGELWWNSTTGVLYIYYDDGDSAQWVDATYGSSLDLADVLNRLDIIEGDVTTAGSILKTIDDSIGVTVQGFDANTVIDANYATFDPTGTYANLRAQATTAGDVGLGNVTNESKATMFTDAALTGVPTAPTAAAATNTTQIATTAFVQNEINTAALALGTNYSVADITERDALTGLVVGDIIFVADNGDTKWAQYKVTAVGTPNTFLKIMDQDVMLNALSAANIKTAYESNADTNVFTDTEKTNLGNLTNVTHAIASTSEAEAGSVNDKYMTPLRTKEAILELSPPTDLSGVEGRLDTIEGDDQTAGSIAKALADAKTYTDQEVAKFDEASEISYDNTVSELTATDVQAAIDEIVAAGLESASVTISQTEPQDPEEGDLWFNSEEGVLYIYYDDGTTAQWVALTYGEFIDAENIGYDNTTSGLTATDVQAAIDELSPPTDLTGVEGRLDTLEGDVTTTGSVLKAIDDAVGNVTNESKETMFTNAALTGVPIAPTAAAQTDTTQIATTAFVQGELSSLALGDTNVIEEIQAEGTPLPVTEKAVNVTRESLSLDNVENFGIANQQEAEEGTVNNKYMTPLRTSEAIAQLAPTPVIATKEEAEAGSINDKFMTPLRTSEAIAEQALSQEFFITIEESDWNILTIGDWTDNYIAVKTVTGLPGNVNPLVDVDLSNIDALEANDVLDEFKEIFGWEVSSENQMTFYASRDLTEDIDLLIRWVK